MKKILIAIALLMCIPSFAMNLETPFWTCTQIGQLDNTPVIIISDIQTTKFQDIKQRERKFEEAVKKKWELTKKFEARCIDYKSMKDAKETHESIIKKASKLNLVVLPIDFNCKEEEHAASR